ncbi:TPA: Dabb family protein [Candidatus Woesearchaeota archaeon]|nr:Dabb family protein [Candidatus Woesearchaeota archaeon]HIH32160.1 Dabb family protein [Candidatus Woesearchaeota archaeon]HIH55053.1 Dabb family protein [Candidatus Woesearchaeota archaeon]HIJ02475.1 Dabb family protein [Candidatus Woesearchaeota archaeon]HIJ14645.1 Dabb family protein [Candidatus Woesearchaeota archaeon]
MIVHVFLFKWKQNAKKKEIDEIFRDIEKLRSSEGLIGMRYGEDFSGYAKGHTHALVVSFKDKQSLKKYMNDPLHKDIINRIDKLKQEWIGADFEAKK